MAKPLHAGLAARGFGLLLQDRFEVRADGRGVGPARARIAVAETVIETATAINESRFEWDDLANWRKWERVLGEWKKLPPLPSPEAQDG